MPMRGPPATHFKRYNREHPERGGAQKDDAFRHRGAIKAHRVLISDVINVHLEHAGLAVRVHPESLEQRQLAPQAGAKVAPQRKPRVPRTGDRSVRACRRCSTSGRSGRLKKPRNRHRHSGIGNDGRASSGSRRRSPWPTNSTRLPRPGPRPAIMHRRGQWWTSTRGGQTPPWQPALADLSHASAEKLWEHRPEESGTLSDRTGGAAGRLSPGSK